MSATSRPSYDIGSILDDGPWTGAQILASVIAALAIILDGFDGQLIGFAIPSLIQEWGVSRGDFAPIVAAGLVGMAIGSLIAGYIGDRFGRRAALFVSVLLFGVATSAIGLSPNLVAIGALRFIAGLGIGGCLPSATTLAAEFTPQRRRALVVTATIVSFPLGGVLAGLFAGSVLPAYGWRGLFLAGGLVPVVFAFLLLIVLPESPRYLAHHAERRPELLKLLARFGRTYPADAIFIDPAEQAMSLGTDRPGGIKPLFEGARARDTMGLWLAFFACLFAIYSVFSWLPTMLVAEGLSQSVAGGALTAYNLGGVFGALLCAQFITRFGSRWPMIVCAAGGAATILLLRVVSTQNTTLIVAMFGLHGLFVNAVNCTLYAVSAFLYPTDIRATATATALGVGRLGAILSAFVGAALITAGGPSAFLNALGLAMVVVTIALATLRHHIAPAVQRVAVQPA